MKYKYQIISESQILKISELKYGTRIGYCWKIEDLKNDYSKTFFLREEETVDSFNRTQNWLKENHPEYMI